LSYTHVSAVKFTPEAVEQKLLPTENYLKNRVVFRTKFYPTFWNNFYPLTASKERKKVGARCVSMLLNSLALEK
jgi:hypothetical protein